MWRLYVGAALVAALGFAFWQYGAVRYSAGYDAAEADALEARLALQDDLFKSGQRIAALAAALEASRSEQAALVMELENAALQDPDGARPGIGSDGLQRLRSRWAAP